MSEMSNRNPNTANKGIFFTPGVHNSTATIKKINGIKILSIKIMSNNDIKKAAVGIKNFRSIIKMFLSAAI